MKIEQKKWSSYKGWEQLRSDDKANSSKADLVMVFGSRDLLDNPHLYNQIAKSYPVANIVMNSTSGEIIDTQVNDETLSLTAICFDKTTMKTACINIISFEDSKQAGKAIANSFDTVGLANLFVIADGQKVNGSDLVEGIQQHLPKGIIITGGLAGDGSRFQKTLAGLNATPTEGTIIAIGFYGADLTVSHGSVGGWDAFGPERLVTKSKGNILFELDGQPALDIYKKYLGDYSKELPGSGLLFPLCIHTSTKETAIVRTILSINEDEKSLTFAGNMPQGSYARLMKANFDRLIEGAGNAAHNSMQMLAKPDLAILISCVGRKLVLNQRIEEEVEAVRDRFGEQTAITGFYSYGEISPVSGFSTCGLHNQTMTITTMTEN